jgi:preprotein translocase subunit YajC
LATLILLAAMFVLLWALLIRPQRRRQLEQQRLLSSVEPGDEVLTVGGLYGIVRDIDEEDDLIVEIADGIQVRIARRSVGGVVKPEEEIDDDEAEETDAEESYEPEPERQEGTADGDREARVADSEEIVRTEDPEDTAALDRR